MRISVVGAGITGMFVSYYLRKAGHGVMLVEKNSPVSYTSKYNAGYLAPSFFTIKSAKAAVSVGYLASTMFGPRGPIYISPWEVVKNVGWFRTATGKIRGYEEKVQQAGFKSLALYNEFFNEEPSIDVDRIQGLCALYENAEDGKEAARDLNGRFLDGKEIGEMGFSNLEGGVLIENNISLNSHKLFTGLSKRLSEMGVNFQTGNDIKVVTDGGRVTFASIDGRRIDSDVCVVTAGANCGDLLRSVGYDPHILPGIGRVLIFDTGGAKITERPAMLEDEGISVVQHNENTFRATSFFELRGFNKKFPGNRKKWLLDTMKKYLRNYDKLRLVEEGVGFRPCCSDQLPVIGLVPGYENLYIASGACRVGVTIAPVTGYIIESLINGREPNDVPWRSFDPARFSKRQ